jgi:hypothetical protein
MFVFGTDEINLKKSTSSPAVAQPFQLTVMTDRSTTCFAQPHWVGVGVGVGEGGGVGTGVLWEL